MKSFGGNILFLDRSDINTDEIIPAKYLTEITKNALKPFLLEDLILDDFDPVRDVAGKQVVVTRANFGCGSSREHAPWALEVNDIYVVIAENFARIFRQNMFNCGMCAIELKSETIDHLFNVFKGISACVNVDLDRGLLAFSGGGKTETVEFQMAPFDRELIEAGGWVEYADSKY